MASYQEPEDLLAFSGREDPRLDREIERIRSIVQRRKLHVGGLRAGGGGARAPLALAGQSALCTESGPWGAMPMHANA